MSTPSAWMPPAMSLHSRTRPKAKRHWPSPSRQLQARCTSLPCRKSTESTYGTRGAPRKTIQVVDSQLQTIKAKAPRLSHPRNLMTVIWVQPKTTQCLPIPRQIKLSHQVWWSRIQARDHLMHSDKIKIIKDHEPIYSCKNTNQMLSRMRKKLRPNYNKTTKQISIST